MVKFIVKGVSKIMSNSLDKGKEIVEVVMDTPETRNKTGEVLMGLGVGVVVLGWCVSDHRPHKITPRDMNKIRYFINRCGWILLATSWILPQYTFNTVADSTDNTNVENIGIKED